MARRQRWTQFPQAKGESNDAHARRAHAGHLWWWEMEKKNAGKWLPAEEYEKKTGKKGRRDD